MSTENFGWELFFTLYKPKSKHHAIICFIHWSLIRCNFRCVGIGDNAQEFNESDKSELLPVGWNESNKINLRYSHNDKLYILVSILDGDNVITNLNSTADQQAGGINISVDEIQNLNGPSASVFKNVTELTNRVNEQLLEPVLDMNRPSVSTQTSSTSTRIPSDDPLRILSPPEHGHGGIYVPPRPFMPAANVGRADLYPFGQGGGMLADPPGFGRGRHSDFPQPGLPRGAVPPGARFDPFRPPGTQPRGPRPQNPDFDHFPPPGYDDMFM